MNLKDLTDKVSGFFSNTANYFNPTSNSGNNFWRTPVAQGMAKAQNSLSQQYSVPAVKQTFSNAVQAGIPAMGLGKLGSPATVPFSTFLSQRIYTPLGERQYQQDPNTLLGNSPYIPGQEPTLARYGANVVQDVLQTYGMSQPNHIPELSRSSFKKGLGTATAISGLQKLGGASWEEVLDPVNFAINTIFGLKAWEDPAFKGTALKGKAEIKKGIEAYRNMTPQERQAGYIGWKGSEKLSAKEYRQQLKNKLTQEWLYLKENEKALKKEMESIKYGATGGNITGIDNSMFVQKKALLKEFMKNQDKFIDDYNLLPPEMRKSKVVPAKTSKVVLKSSPPPSVGVKGISKAEQALIDTAKSYGIDSVIPNDKQLKAWTENQILSGNKNVIEHLKKVEQAGKPISISSSLGVKRGGETTAPKKLTYEQAIKTPEGIANTTGDSYQAIVAEDLAQRTATIPKAVYEWAKKTNTDLQAVWKDLANGKIKDTDIVRAVLNDEPIKTSSIQGLPTVDEMVQRIQAKQKESLLSKGFKQVKGGVGDTKAIILQKQQIEPVLKNNLKAAADYDPQFKLQVEKLAKTMGKEYSHGPVKDLKRSLDKVISEKGGRLEDLEDYNRSVLFTDDFISNVNGIVDQVRQNFGEPVKIKPSKQTELFKKLIVNVKTPNGNTAELQFTTPEMWKAKIELNGDAMYHKWRNLEPNTRIWKILDRKMNELYGRAEAAAEARINSSSVISAPSARAFTGGKGLPSEVIPKTLSLEGSTSTLTNTPSTSKNLGKSDFILPPSKNILSSKQPLVNNQPANGSPKVEQMGRSEVQSVAGASSGVKQTQPMPEGQKSQGAGGTSGSKTPSGSSIPLDDKGLVRELTEQLRGAKKLRISQEEMYSRARGEKFAKMMSAREKMAGEKGFYQELGALKGELPKVEYEPVRQAFTQEKVDRLFNIIKQTDRLGEWEKINAEVGLSKILGEKGLGVPTKGEIANLYKVFGREFTEAILEKRSLFTQWGENLMQLYNLSRSMMAGVGDLSATLMQGGLIASKHPVITVKNFARQLHYFASEGAYQEGLKEINNRSNKDLYRKAKLAITDASPIITEREEQFMAPIAESTPIYGRIIRATSRAYTGFLNRMRADVFDAVADGYEKSGGDVNNPEFLRSLGSYLNVATGRGDLGQLERVAPVLAQGLFSPRKLVATFQTLNPMWYAKLHPYVRKEALMTMMTFFGTASALTQLSKLAGAEVNNDPTSSDFQKVKIGNTRFNFYGPYQQLFVLLARQVKGYATSSTTGRKIMLGDEDNPYAPSRLDLLVRYFESKEHPTLGYIISAMRGKNAIGEEFKPAADAVNMFLPMLLSDGYDLYKEHGAVGLLGLFPAILGIPAQTYGRQIPNMDYTKAGKPKVTLRSVPGLAEDIVNTITGRSASNVPEDQQQSMVQAKQKEQWDKYVKQQVKDEAMKGNNFTPRGNFVPVMVDGEVKVIDTSFQPKPPTLTGLAELDKKAISEFNSDITKKANDIYDLYKGGKITMEEANKQLADLKALKMKASGGTKPKKITAKKISAKKFTVSLPKKSKTSTLKLSVPKLKKGSIKANKTKISVKPIKTAKLKGLVAGKKLV